MFYFLINKGLILNLRKIIYFLDNILNFISDLIIQSNSNNKIIVFIRTDALGDFLLWLGAADKLSATLNEFSLVLICNDSYSGFAKDLNYFSQVIPININSFKKNYLYRLFFLISLKKINPHSVINPIKSRNFLIDDTVVRFINSDSKIGCTGDHCNISINEKKISDNWYSQLIKINKKIISEIEFNSYFINSILSTKYQVSLGNLKNYINQNYAEIISKNYIIICPGSSWEGKSWSIDNFINLVRMILINYDFDIILTGIRDDAILCEKIRKISPFRIKNMAGKTSIKDLISLILESKLVVGNDSAIVHLSAILKIKSICILGGGHFGRFHPYPDFVISTNPIPVFYKMDCYDCNWKCIKVESSINPKPCISKITTSMVFNSISQILKSKKAFL